MYNSFQEQQYLILHIHKTALLSSLQLQNTHDIYVWKVQIITFSLLPACHSFFLLYLTYFCFFFFLFSSSLVKFLQPSTFFIFSFENSIVESGKWRKKIALADSILFSFSHPTPSNSYHPTSLQFFTIYFSSKSSFVSHYYFKLAFLLEVYALFWIGEKNHGLIEK